MDPSTEYSNRVKLVVITTRVECTYDCMVSQILLSRVPWPLTFEAWVQCNRAVILIPTWHTRLILARSCCRSKVLAFSTFWKTAITVRSYSSAPYTSYRPKKVTYDPTCVHPTRNHRGLHEIETAVFCFVNRLLLCVLSELIIIYDLHKTH